jgi:hypothetical protein
LPLEWTDRELSASAARVWSVQQELTERGWPSWWTPHFMSGSSEALNYARGLYLLPWLLLTPVAGLQAAGKLMCLGAIFLSAITTYFCARRLLRNNWAAAVAALAMLLHPQQIYRAIGAEHMTISLFFPFIALLWLTFARALETHRLRDVFWCALAVVAAMAADNKQALVHLVFLTGYLVYWLWPAERRAQWKETLKTCAAISVAVVMLGVFIVVPGLIEHKLVKLFQGDPLAAWQQGFSSKSLFGIVDRNGAVTAMARDGAMARVQQQGGVRSQGELEQIRYLMATTVDSPEKYAGLIWVAVLAITALYNTRRQDRGLFWTFVALLLLSIMFTSGPQTVWRANTRLLGAWFGVEGVPGLAKLGGGVAVAAVGVFLWLLWRRKLSTTQKRILAAGALVAFLFLPAFAIISHFPLFQDIRAPYVFWDGPQSFIGAMLLGFFVTDVCQEHRWKIRPALMTLGLTGLLLWDYWPCQSVVYTNVTSARTIHNLEHSYRIVGSDRDWMKTYSVSGRYFHLLGPMWSGKPQVYEAFYNWMCPTGTGYLNQFAFASWEHHRSFLNLMGARYVVYDKSDPNNAGNQQMLALYRQTFPAHAENEDIVVFRNDSAHSYVSANTHACLYSGDLRASAPLTLALSQKNFTLVEASHPVTDEQRKRYAKTYTDQSAAYSPLATSAPVPLTDVQLTRENHERIQIQLTAPTNCIAVIAESYYPFWTATVDSKPAEVLRVNCAQMGLDLPAGRHEIVLQYRPPFSYTVAGIVSLLTLIAGLGYAVASQVRSHRLSGKPS